MNNIFYDFDKMISYNSLLNFIIGERGVGKTYGAKKYVVNHFLKKHKQFVYLRRYKDELKKSMIQGNKGKFFDQIKDEFPDVKFENDGNTMKINDEIAGYGMILTKTTDLKSATFENVDTIIFDEFIIDKGFRHYVPDEVNAFLGLIDTIVRMRDDVRVVFLGNAISTTNPYFIYFNLTLPYNSEFKIEKRDDKGRPLILVNYIKNEAYRAARKLTRFGQLIEDTKYGEYAIDNKFLRDNKTFIEHKSGDAKFFFTIKLNNMELGVWNDYNSGKMYISQDVDPLCPTKIALDDEDHDYDTILVRTRSSGWFKTLLDRYRMGQLCFENQKVKNIFMDHFQRYLIY